METTDRSIYYDRGDTLPSSTMRSNPISKFSHGNGLLTLLSLASYLWDKASGIAPEETLQNAASHLGQYCLLKVISPRNITQIKIFLILLK